VAQFRLLRGLAEAHDRVGDSAGAARLWRQLAAERPNDLGIQLVLFDRALRADDEQGLQRVLAAIQRLDGPDGTLANYGKASLLLWKARRGDRRGLALARALLANVATRRPVWSRVPACLARVEDLAGDRGAALRHYLRSIDLGERDPAAIRRAAELLSERSRYFEADQIVRKLPEVALVGDLRRLAAVVSLRNRDYDRALTLAERAVAAGSKDYRDHVWLGQVLAAVPKRESEAEAKLREAVKLAPEIPETWLALINHLARRDRQKAEEAIREAERKLPRDKAALALAQAYQTTGNEKRAGELYRAALAARPDDPAALRGLAAFCIQTGKLSAAQPYLRRLMALKGNSQDDLVWAQLALAWVQTLGGDFQGSRGALKLVGEVAGLDPVARKRAQALVLSQQKDPKERRKAIELLEDLDGSLALPANDQFLLARLYESVGNWTKARTRMLPLLDANQDNPVYLAYFCGGLLRHQEREEESRLWIDKLEKLRPEALETVELKAVLLAQQGKAPEGTALIQRYAEGKGRPPAELLRLGALLERLKQDPAAEAMYRLYVASSSQDTAPLVLARYFGRRNRPEEALDLCERALRTCSPEAVASTGLTILSTARATKAQRQRVGSWLETALRRDPRNDVVRIHLAVLRTLQERYQEAETLYRRLADTDKANVRAMAMNNLAWLLVMRGSKPDESMDLLRRAMELTGPEPGLLDTRALVYLKLGKSQPAIEDLQSAIAAAPTASAYFHLARAHHLARNRAAAKLALKKATELGLVPESLHPLERRDYSRLSADLDS
jgi:tetratricopeptide (TPR) repeat protein